MFDYDIVALILFLTIGVYVYYYKHIDGIVPKLALFTSLLSIFIYSGYGISMNDVSNSYIVNYFVSILCFSYPFYKEFKINRSVSVSNIGWFDTYLVEHYFIIKYVALFYLLLTLFPCVFPSFKLFDVLLHGISITDIYEQYNFRKDNQLIRLSDSIRMFIAPFFYAYILFLRVNSSKKILPLLLLLLNIYLEVARFSYIGRYQMVVDFLIVYFFYYCIDENGFLFSKKQLIILSSIALLSVPFMYAYLYIRLGVEAETLSFTESFTSLIESEVYYPQYYEHILTSSILRDESSLKFILWLICLPIPSVVWAEKPTLHNDVFTFSLTGLHRTDDGYSSLLPSYLGESMIYFGNYFYWFYALLIGFIFAKILIFLLKNKYLLLYAVVLSLKLLVIGRAGATAIVPTFINGCLLLFLIYWINNKKTCESSF